MNAISTCRTKKGVVFYKNSMLENNFTQCSSFYPFLRQGLYYYLQKLNYKSVLLPHLVPEGIIDPFKRLGFQIYFYDINSDFRLDKHQFDRKFDVVVYIHYYGVYVKENLDYILSKRANFSLFIEDCAHMVYNENFIFCGDIVTFSFTKIIGLSEGSCILYNKAEFCESDYSKEKRIKSLILNIKSSTFLFINSISNRFLRSLINLPITILKLNDYYSYLMKNYSFLKRKINKKNISYLCKVNFPLICNIRQEYAELYYKNLEKSLLFNIPKRAYLGNGLFAFPIIVPNQQIFISELNKINIYPLVLTQKWWFGDDGDKYIRDHHLLLPINQELSRKQILFIIENVNQIYYNAFHN